MESAYNAGPVRKKEGSSVMGKRFVGEALCQTARVRYYLLEEDAAEPASYGVEIELEGETAAVGLISVFEDPGNSMDGGVLPAAAPPGGGSREYKGEAGVRRPAAEGLLGSVPVPTEEWSR